MSWFWYVFSPVLAHLVISELTAFFAGSVLDSAACTALSALLVLPLALMLYRRDQPLHKESRESGGRFVLLVLCFALGGLLNMLWSGILNLVGITSAFSNQTQAALFGSALLMQIVGPGLLVPAAEEMVFRGLAYTRMRTRLPLWQSILFSSLLFALYHGNPIQMIYAFPMAAVLAWLYEKSRSLWAPVLLHMGANLTAILVTLL